MSKVQADEFEDDFDDSEEFEEEEEAPAPAPSARKAAPAKPVDEDLEEEEETPKPSANAPSAVKRGRGRPPKASTPATLVDESGEETPLDVDNFKKVLGAYRLVPETEVIHVGKGFYLIKK